jgi:hypothetical protein
VAVWDCYKKIREDERDLVIDWFAGLSLLPVCRAACAAAPATGLGRGRLGARVGLSSLLDWMVARYWNKQSGCYLHCSVADSWIQFKVAR